MKDQNQQELFSAIHDALDEFEQSLNDDTLRKLQTARNKALSIKTKHQGLSPWLSATVIAGLVLVVIWHQQPSWDQTAPVDVQEQLFLTEENSDLIEDLEFYRWLEQTAEIEKITHT
jgi:hypothetical protein